jgi:hypothetical protein
MLFAIYIYIYIYVPILNKRYLLTYWRIWYLTEKLDIYIKIFLLIHFYLNINYRKFWILAYLLVQNKSYKYSPIHFLYTVIFNIFRNTKLVFSNLKNTKLVFLSINNIKLYSLDQTNLKGMLKSNIYDNWCSNKNVSTRRF